MNDVLLTPIRINEFEVLIENSVKRALSKNGSLQPNLEVVETPLNMDNLEKLTGYSKQTLYGYCQKSSIPHHKKNGRLFFFKSEIIDWIKDGKQKTLAEVDEAADQLLSSKKSKSKSSKF